jgi:hypothetical protein
LQSNDREKYWQFAKMNHELSKNITLRGMLRFKGSSSGKAQGNQYLQQVQTQQSTCSDG